MADNFHQHGFLNDKHTIISTGKGSELSYFFIKLESYAKKASRGSQQMMAVCLLSIINSIHTLERQTNKTQKHPKINKAVRHIEMQWNKAPDLHQMPHPLPISYHHQPHKKRPYKFILNMSPMSERTALAWYRNRTLIALTRSLLHLTVYFH